MQLTFLLAIAAFFVMLYLAIEWLTRFLAQKTHQKWQPFFALILLVGTLLLGFEGLTWLFSNKTGLSLYCRDIKTFVAENQPVLERALTQDFEAAVQCQTSDCLAAKQPTFLAELQKSDQLYFFQTSYLIRLNRDGNIEKWFWNGEVKTTVPSTWGEKKVRALLTGRRGALCTQGYKVDASSTTMTYLKDGYSEAELVVPIKSQTGQVIGAWVSRWGD